MGLSAVEIKSIAVNRIWYLLYEMKDQLLQVNLLIESRMSMLDFEGWYRRPRHGEPTGIVLLFAVP
jgi:hypothetical protein